MAKLFAVWHSLELVALPSEHPRCLLSSTGDPHAYSPCVRLLSTSPRGAARRMSGHRRPQPAPSVARQSLRRLPVRTSPDRESRSSRREAARLFPLVRAAAGRTRSRVVDRRSRRDQGRRARKQKYEGADARLLLRLREDRDLLQLQWDRHLTLASYSTAGLSTSETVVAWLRGVVPTEDSSAGKQRPAQQRWPYASTHTGYAGTCAG